MTTIDNVSAERLAVRSGLQLARVRAIIEGRWTPSPRERQVIAAALNQDVATVSFGHRSPVEHLYGPN